MFQVKIINDGVETIIHSPYVDGLKLSEGVIKRGVNKIDAFNLAFTLNNPAYGRMKTLETLIKVFNLKKNQYEFEGRVLELDEEMDSEGLHTFSYVCEGELGYLHDSQQRHLEFRGTPRQLLETIIAYHNLQVEDYKRFEVGEMNVTNSTDNQYVYLSAEQSTLDTIKDKLIDRLGGEVRIRKENGIRYLDYLERIGESKDTEIRLAKNLLTISRSIDPTEIITRLTPLGTRIESEDEEATDASQARLTIESVNGGVPWIDNPALIAEFGIQGKSIVWDDITDPNNLLNRGTDYITNQKTSLNQYKVSAADLFLIGLDPDSFDVGNDYPVINPIMGIDERLRVIGKSTDILQPKNDILTIGDKLKTLDEYQVESNESSRKVVELENTVERQSIRVSELRKQLVEEAENLQQQIKKIDTSDLPALEDALSNLIDSVDALTEAVDSIPIYEPVTESTDGLMIAADKLKLDKITVVNAVDLDQIVQKVAELEQEVESLQNESQE